MRTQNAPDHDRSASADDVPIESDIWVPARQAALALPKPERWLREECQAGHLPCKGEPRTGQVFLVPMAATEHLAEHPPPGAQRLRSDGPAATTPHPPSAR